MTRSSGREGEEAPCPAVRVVGEDADSESDACAVGAWGEGVGRVARGPSEARARLTRRRRRRRGGGWARRLGETRRKLQRRRALVKLRAVPRRYRETVADVLEGVQATTGVSVSDASLEHEQKQRLRHAKRSNNSTLWDRMDLERVPLRLMHATEAHKVKALLAQPTLSHGDDAQAPASQSATHDTNTS